MFKVTRFFVLTFFLVAIALIGRTQEALRYYSPPKLESFNDATDCIYLADSLFNDYKKSKFYELLPDSSISDGLSIVERFYNQALTLNPSVKETKRVNKQLKKCTESLANSVNDAGSYQYGRLISKAEETFKAGDLDKAFEYYSRARNLMPSDKRPVRALKKIEKLKTKTSV